MPVFNANQLHKLYAHKRLSVVLLAEVPNKQRTGKQHEHRVCLQLCEWNAVARNQHTRPYPTECVNGWMQSIVCGLTGSLVRKPSTLYTMKYVLQTAANDLMNDEYCYNLPWFVAKHIKHTVSPLWRPCSSHASNSLSDGNELSVRNEYDTTNTMFALCYCHYIAASSPHFASGVETRKGRA